MSPPVLQSLFLNSDEVTLSSLDVASVCLCRVAGLGSYLPNALDLNLFFIVIGVMSGTFGLSSVELALVGLLVVLLLRSSGAVCLPSPSMPKGATFG